MDYLWVLSAWQVLLTCIYHLSVITCKYYAHDRIHSRVLHPWQDSLVSITCMTGFTSEYSVITREYKSARQELLKSIFNSSVIAREQCTSHVTWGQHVSYLQNFSRHEVLLIFFYKLGRELYHIWASSTIGFHSSLQLTFKNTLIIKSY